MSVSGHKAKRWLSLVIWVAVYLIVARFIGDMTREEIPGWYRGLVKPPLNPPDIAFPVVWTSLYILIAVSGWRLWNRRSHLPRLAIPLFAIQTVMNWAWSYFFFDFHMLGFSFIWLIGLVGCVGALIVSIRAVDRLSACFLLPYLLWIAFASYLNGMIWHLN